jgi:hypothetical protein
MRFTLSRSGGVAGLRRAPLVVDTKDLPPAEGERLRALALAAALAAEREPPGADDAGDAAARDRFGYSLAVTHDDGREVVRSFELASAPEPLKELVAALREAQRTG